MEEIKAADMLEFRQVTRLLKVLFTEKEKIELGEQIAGTIRDLKAKRDDLDSIKSRYGSDIKALEAQLSSLAERLNSGWETRLVNCDQIKDYRTGTFIIRRMDTGEHVEERALTTDELQMGLFEKQGESNVGSGDIEKQEEDGASGSAPEPPGIPDGVERSGEVV